MTNNTVKTTGSQQKKHLRQALLQRRESLDPQHRTEKNRTILTRLQDMPELSAAARIFCYISHGTEPDTHAVLDWLYTQDTGLAVPKIIQRSHMTAVAFSGWNTLQPGPKGIPEPVSSTEYTGDFDVCITPGLGFTESGARLGYGHGYYDKWFANHTAKLKLGLCYECQLLETLPMDAHDMPVDMIVTEDRTIRVR